MMLPRPFLVAMFLLLPPLGVVAQSVSFRETFALVLGASMVAEKTCQMRGELGWAQGWVDKFQTGFDFRRNREDTALFLFMAAKVEARRKEIGSHTWCVEYRARKYLMEEYGL